MKVCQCGTLTQMMTHLTWETKHRLSWLVRSVNPCSLCLPWFYYVLLHFIWILLPLLCSTVYLSFLLWNSSDPEDRFLFYAFIMNNNVLLCVFDQLLTSITSWKPGMSGIVGTGRLTCPAPPLVLSKLSDEKHCSLRRKGRGVRRMKKCEKWKSQPCERKKRSSSPLLPPPPPPKKKEKRKKSA